MLTQQITGVKPVLHESHCNGSKGGYVEIGSQKWTDIGYFKSKI